ncbi:MAG: hypothetical protein HONDAALG_00172 [Gammaproteobacteria bacterium]|nr:hypothetical protein [Gammaproteobacteria bacterium]
MDIAASTARSFLGAFKSAVPPMLLLVLCALLYWPGLRGELIVDDLPNLKPFGDLERGLIRWQDIVADNASGPLGRPLAMLSFLADYYVGGGRVFQFKLTNLLIHLLCGVLVYALAGLLFARHRTMPPAARRWWALLAMALWLTAPLFASTVLYVIQRMAQLATLFSLVGLVSYVYGREQLDISFRRGAAFILAAYLIALPLAVLSKENGAILPLLILVTEIFWFGFAGQGRAVRFLRTVHALFAVVPVIAGAVWLATHTDAFLSRYAGRDFTLSERLMTQARVLWDYLAQLFLPNGLRMGVIHDDFVISRSLANPPTTAIAIAAWIAVITTLVLWRKSVTVRLLAFGLTFFLIGHLIESTVLPLEIYFEHRNYLPATGLFIAAAGVAAHLCHRFEGLRRVAVLLALIPLLTGFIAYQRVMTWQSAEAIALMAENSHGRSPRLQTALISRYLRDGDLGNAKRHINMHAELVGGRTAGHALHELEAYCRVGHSPSDAEYRAIVATERVDMSVYTHERILALADLLQHGNCARVDLGRLQPWFRALARQIEAGTDWLNQFHFGRLLWYVGEREGAVRLFDAANRSDPARLEPDLIKIQILLSQGDRDAARGVLATLNARMGHASKYQREVIEQLKRTVAAETEAGASPP